MMLRRMSPGRRVSGSWCEVWVSAVAGVEVELVGLSALVAMTYRLSRTVEVDR
jgi:hypothetical protein